MIAMSIAIQNELLIIVKLISLSTVIIVFLSYIVL